MTRAVPAWVATVAACCVACGPAEVVVTETGPIPVCSPVGHKADAGTYVLEDNCSNKLVRSVTLNGEPAVRVGKGRWSATTSGRIVKVDILFHDDVNNRWIGSVRFDSTREK